LNTNEDEAIAFLEHYDAEYGPIINQYVLASWNYETNLTDENAMAVVSISYFLNENSFYYTINLHNQRLKLAEWLEPITRKPVPMLRHLTRPTLAKILNANFPTCNPSV
jgi:hypothetical protein